jgi:hypothetical protein
MAITIPGIVKNGVVVPNTPLPEGAHVEISLSGGPVQVPPELQEELAAWQQASANALALVERMAQESAADEKR